MSLLDPRLRACSEKTLISAAFAIEEAAEKCRAVGVMEAEVSNCLGDAHAFVVTAKTKRFHGLRSRFGESLNHADAILLSMVHSQKF